MFVADRYINIKETEEYRMDEAKAEKLDEMLNQFGVVHFFSYPIESENGIAIHDDHFLSLAYDSKDELTVTLVYALWMKTVRGIEEERIIKGLTKFCERK